jgi:hypothetical protein
MTTIHDDYIYNTGSRRWEGPDGFVLKSTERKTFAAITNDGTYIGGDFVGFEAATKALWDHAREQDANGLAEDSED